MCVSGLILMALLYAPVAPVPPVFAPPAPPPPAPTSDVFTTLDYAAAFEKAKADDLLLIVDATAEWCGPCKRMERETWSKAEVAQALSGVALPIQVDVDEQQELAQQLKISAMPTIIAIRDGKEIDRHVGYLGPTDFLEWFEAVREGVNLTEEKRKVALEQDTALLESSDEEARYKQAKSLVAVGEYDRALAHYLWLWENIGAGSPMIGVRSTFMLSDMTALALQHPPAKKAFDDLRGALHARAESDSQSLSAGEWNDWFTLDAHFEESRRVLQWFDSIELDEEGLAAVTVSTRERQALEKKLLDLLIERGRLSAAARLGTDLEQCTSAAVAVYKIVQSSNRLDMLPTDIREQMERSGQVQLRAQLSQFHAVALLAGDAGAAEHIAGRLIDFLDDADSRVELVRIALDADVPPTGQFSVWLDEAAELGEPVDALRKKLGRAGG